MDTWQDRVRIELTNLEEKIKKLGGFLIDPSSAHLSPYQIALLESQLFYMTGYAKILKARLGDT